MAEEETVVGEAPLEEPPESVEAAYGDEGAPGFLLTALDHEVVEYLHEQWSAQRDLYARRICEAEVNRRRRAGEGNIWAEKVEDEGRFRVYAAHGGGKLNQWYQKANRLCLRSVAVLHQDPPEPNGIPQTGEAEDRDAAEFGTRVLKDVCSESGLNQHEAHKQAFDWASNGGSAYIWYFTDPYGGGRQAIEVDANPMAQHIDQAMQGPPDPATGQPTQYTGPTETRYVTPTGALSPQKKDAAKRWVPKVTRQVVEFGNVRLLPETATDIWDADGLLYAAYHPWKVLKGWFGQGETGLDQVSPEDQAAACAFRLKDADHLLPRRGGKKHDPKPKEGHEGDKLCLLMIHWCVEGPEYPDGAYIVTVGNKLVPHRGPWMLETDQGTQRRDLPFVQVMQWRGDKDTPTGIGQMDFLGPSNEGRGELYEQVLNVIDKALNPLTLVPLGSTIQPQDLTNPLNTTIPFQPGFEPKRFEGPKLPPEAFKLLEIIDHDMNDATGMGEASAEGMEAPNVNSGRHALAIQAAQTASLSDLNQNVNRAYQRAWRIIQQCIMADYDVPLLLHYTDKDGGYKVKRWLGSDLSSIRDVEILRGTGTLFNPAQKAEYVAQYAQIAQIPIEDVRELLATGYNPYTSLQDDDTILRVRRQLAQWEEGPPAGWAPPPPQPPPPVLGVDPTGQPITAPAPPPPPYDPVFGADQRPVDVTPIAAGKRIRELGKAMESTTYGDMPPEWKEALNQEFARMQQALAPPPPPPGGPPVQEPPAQEKAELSPAEKAMAGQ